MNFPRLLTLSLCLIAASCASTAPVVVGKARPPISPDQVKIYLSPPPSFEEVAILSASSNSAFTPGGPTQMNKIIAHLKEEAAKLGANGVILEGFSDAETGSLGTGAGSQSYSGHSAVGVGVGGSFGIFKKTGKGRAIFVPPT
jgi:hypothetical protein